MINCILNYGQFTTLLKMPHVLQEIHMMRPESAEVSLLPMGDITQEQLKDAKMTFQLEDKINEDTYVYRFVSNG